MASQNNRTRLFPWSSERPNGNGKSTNGFLASRPSNGSGNHGISGFDEHLLKCGVITKEILQNAHELWRGNGIKDRRRLFQILIDEFAVDRELVYEEFVKYYSFKTLDLSDDGIPKDQLIFISKTLELLPPLVKEAALMSKILPYEISENDPLKLLLVTPDPTNPDLTSIVRTFPYPKHELLYISLKNYKTLYEQLLSENRHRPATQEFDFVEEEQDVALEDLDEEIRKGHLNEIIDNILIDAARLSASDIHFVPRSARKTEVHFRIDGHLSLWQSIEDIRVDAVAAVVKDLAKGTDRFERNTAQDGYVQITVDEKVIRFRVSVIPLLGKELKVKLESIVLRVLRDPEDSLTINNIGFHPFALERFRKAIEKPFGIVILTGPTGCGKSTTLLAAIRSVMSPALNIITVEDPVEYFIDGARQVKLNSKLGFEEALRAILRHDPDIVMVGEIRDRQTAEFAINLANTGHLTFSTLHTNDAPSAIARLYKMGIEPFLLSYSINIIVAQRLLRKLCDRCKILDTEVLPSVFKKLGVPEEDIPAMKIYRPVGCLHCIKGYKGRTAIHEVLYFTKEVRQIIMDAGSAINEEALRQLAIRQGMQTLRQSAVELLKKGITTIEEVASTTIED
jgi:type IV pilus assembly protein PilB